jgi:hypothetical protein
MSTLRRFAEAWQDPDPDGKFNAARALWNGMGICVIFPDDVHGMDRDWVKAFGDRRYGGHNG